MSEQLRRLALSLSVIGLVAAVDDDIMDEHYKDQVAMVKNISTSEILQNFAYLNLLSSDNEADEERKIIANKPNSVNAITPAKIKANRNTIHLVFL